MGFGEKVKFERQISIQLNKKMIISWIGKNVQTYLKLHNN